MKSKMKRQGSTESPRFAVGALAIAGASAANGATVQITFANNVVSSSTGLTNFVADLTGDTIVDAVGYRAWGPANGWEVARVVYGTAGMLVCSAFGTALDPGHRKIGSAINDAGPGVSRGLAWFGFTDAGINGGQNTWGWLDVSATTSIEGGVSASVQIHRLIFDDASTNAPNGVSLGTTYPTFGVSAVPEPGSNLALLALGAGGLTLRRRLKRAA